MESLGNRELTLLAAVLNGVHREYVAQDNSDNGGGGNDQFNFSNDGVDKVIDDIRKEFAKYDTDSMHPQYKELMAKKNAAFKFKGQVEKK